MDIKPVSIYYSYHKNQVSLFIESCYTIKYNGKALDFQQDPLNMWWPLTSEVDDNTTYVNETSPCNVTNIENNSTSQCNDTNILNNNETEICNTSYTENNSSVQCNVTDALSSNDTEISSNADDKLESEEEEPLEMRFFYMYYTTADETEFNTDKLIDLASFIGSVGGNLGLFLGFSFLGMLFPLYDYVEAMYTRLRRKTI